MDELHQQLGRLAAQNEIILHQQSELVQQNIDLRLQVQEIRSDQEAIKNKLEEDVLPDVKDYARLKQRGIGILTVTGTIGVALGTVGEKLISAIFK
ncbi:MAG: protein of unknown function DUF1515 [Podoviridae sp. ctpVR23]|nr:MAG: protein of unknown function DUF1515 [Podoviridae sp. ctpVR23]